MAFTTNGRLWFALKRTSVVAYFGVAASLSSAARADDDANAAEIAAARALAVDGLKLADGGKCADAIEKLARAEKLHHAPVVLGRLGECQIATGKVVEGTENLRKMLREPLPSNPMPAVVKARDRAQAALDAGKPKIATLVISVKGASNASVTIDGQSVSSVLLEADRPTDPGEHVIEATAPGYLKTSARVSLGPGEKQSVALKLEIDPAAQKAAPAIAPEPEPMPVSTRAGLREPDNTARAEFSSTVAAPAPSRAMAYVLWTVGGIGVAAGATFGVLALNGKQDLDKQCPNGICPPSLQNKLDDSKLFGNLSTAAFGVAGLGVLLGTVLYATAGAGSHATTAAHAERAKAPRLSARPVLGLDRAGVVVDF